MKIRTHQVYYQLTDDNYNELKIVCCNIGSDTTDFKRLVKKAKELTLNNTYDRLFIYRIDLIIERTDDITIKEDNLKKLFGIVENGTINNDF